MGRFGSGNFEDDLAWRFLDKRVAEPLRNIVMRADRTGVAETPDEEGYGEALAALELLCLLSKGTGIHLLPERVDLAKMKKAFLSGWVSHARETGVEGEPRRRVIAKTFDVAARLAQGQRGAVVTGKSAKQIIAEEKVKARSATQSRRRKE